MRGRRDKLVDSIERSQSHGGLGVSYFNRSAMYTNMLLKQESQLHASVTGLVRGLCV